MAVFRRGPLLLMSRVCFGRLRTSSVSRGSTLPHRTPAGHGEVADTWVGHGPNKQIEPSHLERVISSDVLEAVAQQTGLSREEILSRLSKNLPEAVDKYTPDGRIPTEM